MHEISRQAGRGRRRGRAVARARLTSRRRRDTRGRHRPIARREIRGPRAANTSAS